MKTERPLWSAAHTASRGSMKALNTPHTAKHSSWSYAEQHGPDDPVLEAARRRGQDLGVTSVSEGAASVLTVLAAAAEAHTLVEVGSGAGVSGVSLLRGAPAQAVLTSIDPDPDHQHAARETFGQEGISTARTRLITGRAEEVLPRLRSGAYDLVLLDADAEHAGHCTGEGLRLLRPGGLLIVNDALDGDKVPRPAVREPSTQTMRAVEEELRDHSGLHTALLPTGTGLLVAVRRTV